ncbi:hypothetical protein C8R43DRAFT_891570, partial [Mycena crocata]
GKLLEDEDFWMDHQRWLETCGYKLRPQYSPDWVASWLGTSKYYVNCEDGQSGLVRSWLIISATALISSILPVTS